MSVVSLALLKWRTRVQLPKWKYVSRPHCLLLILQILRDGELQGRSYRRKQTQSSNSSCSWRHCQLQAREPYNVCVGDPGSTPSRRHLFARQCSQRVLHKPVSFRKNTWTIRYIYWWFVWLKVKVKVKETYLFFSACVFIPLLQVTYETE